MDKNEIKTLIQEHTRKSIDEICVDRNEIKKFVTDSIANAIEERKKVVSKQFKIWSASITAIFSFLLIIGFTTEDIAEKIRNTFLPASHMVKQLLAQGEQSDKLKSGIIGELKKENISKYPAVKEDLEENVWETLTTDNDEVISDFINKSKLDEAIIDSYHDEVNKLVFSTKASDRKRKKETILKEGNVPRPVIIGVYRPNNDELTSCNLPFNQKKKRVIIHIPISEADAKSQKGNNSLPWFQCPKNHYQLLISLSIDGVVVDGIKVVGVERPKELSKVNGIRARVTEVVSAAFKEKGINLGNHVTLGSIRITKVYDDS